MSGVAAWCRTHASGPGSLHDVNVNVSKGDVAPWIRVMRAVSERVELQHRQGPMLAKCRRGAPTAQCCRVAQCGAPHS